MQNSRERDKNRAQNWAIILYPESMPDNWQDLLTELMVPCFVSPLHCDDLNPDGTKKKPHYHVLFQYSSVKSWEQVREDTQCLNCPSPERVRDFRMYARYLCHIDNPSKTQYDPNQVLSIGGLNYQAIAIDDATTRFQAQCDMINYIVENKYTEYCDFLFYCVQERPDWARYLLTNSTYAISEFIKSFRNKLHSEK